jgi:N6-adenosine-specific RNA methylase IME4/ParB-like chromosome segregation protein Spo0J
MIRKAALKAHPYASIFPLLEGEPFDNLVADIKANGLLQPITICENQILDGRNRFQACLAAGIEPWFVEYDGGDPLGFVLSQNLHRRHLDESQRAMVASRIANMRQGERNLQPSANLLKVSQAEAAKRLNVSERSVTFAALIEKQATPDLVHAVEQGKIAVSVAAGLAAAPKAIQHRAATEPERAHILVKQSRRAQRESELAGKQLAWPTQVFGAILADPEWGDEVWSRETGLDRAPDNHFPTSAPDMIMSRPVASLAADDCVLFLWTTIQHEAIAHEVRKAWGFEYRSQIIWKKPSIGMGRWVRSLHEILLIGTRGEPVCPAPGEQYDSVIEAPRGEHSEKPEIFYELIESYFPNTPKIELNARKRRPGWDAWGLEAPDEAAE